MKKTKQFISAILTLIMLISILTSLPISAFAATSGSINDNVKWSLNGTTLTFTGNGVVKIYDDIPWKSQSENIKKIVVGEKITNWDLSCYSVAPNVEEVQLPSTILSIGSQFDFCNKLKKLTVYAKSPSITPGILRISENAVLYGYSGSSLEVYASDYGRTFVDINTKKTSKYTRKNSDLIKLLPTNIPCAEPAISGIRVSETSTGIFKGYDPHIAHETDTSNANYKVIVNQTEKIIKDCKTNMEKTQALANWVATNLHYTVGFFGDALIGNVYNAFNDKVGNCMSFTILLNYMLYIAGIPTATVSTVGHMYSLALIDGKWYDIECTTGQISTNYDRRNDTIEEIAYANSDLTVMLIQNTRGLIFAGPGWNDLDDDETPNNLNVPNNAKLFFKRSVYNNGKNIQNIIGKRGTAGEAWCKNNLPCITYNKNKYYAHPEHTYKTTTIKATTSKNGSVVTKCTACGAVKSKSTIYCPKTITLSTTSYTYNGKVKKPSVTVKDSKGNKISSSNYTVTYSSGRKNVGKYTVTVKFKGNYTGTIKKTFTIKPKTTSISKLTAGKKKFTIKWKKLTAQTTGYQIQYSTSSKFTSKTTKTVTVSKNKTTSKTISKLKAKKKYYVRVRTYKTVKVNGKNTKIYSSWSKAKTVTTK